MRRPVRSFGLGLCLVLAGCRPASKLGGLEGTAVAAAIPRPATTTAEAGAAALKPMAAARPADLPAQRDEDAGVTAGRGGSGAAAQGGSGGAGGAASPATCRRDQASCPADAFCSFAPDADCGQADAVGRCEPRPATCPAGGSAVCGCDGKRYASACEAQLRGVSVARTDSCDAPPVVPAAESCSAAKGCGDARFCNLEEWAGGQGCDGKVAAPGGVCQSRPGSCPDVDQPVCGCDHHTHGSSCEAHAAGVSVLHDGACTQAECTAQGGRLVSPEGDAASCAEGEDSLGEVVAGSGMPSVDGQICCAPDR